VNALGARLTVALLLAILGGPACAALTLSSSDLKADAPISRTHIYQRCGGRNLSPQLSWSGAPQSTKSLVLTMIDLDVKPSQWSHWVVINLPVGTASLAQGAGTLPGSAKAVVSNFGDAAYAGPCPPAGTGVHHYQFTIWALPLAEISIAPDEKATELTAYLSRLALEHGSLTVLVQAPARQ
jgi:Raf kinase inhibitor-like YbhB/YbcL family protein